tara:strand:+ start:65 stop:859 length:795 start_codon:yes stop_codon:yes gene_type:complete
VNPTVKELVDRVIREQLTEAALAAALQRLTNAELQMLVKEIEAFTHSSASAQAESLAFCPIYKALSDRGMPYQALRLREALPFADRGRLHAQLGERELSQGNTALAAENLITATEYFEKAIALSDSASNQGNLRFERANASYQLAQLPAEVLPGDPGAYLLESVGDYRAAASSGTAIGVVALGSLGRIAAEQGAPESSFKLFQASRAVAQEQGITAPQWINVSTEYQGKLLNLDQAEIEEVPAAANWDVAADDLFQDVGGQWKR